MILGNFLTEDLVSSTLNVVMMGLNSWSFCENYVRSHVKHFKHLADVGSEKVLWLLFCSDKKSLFPTTRCQHIKISRADSLRST